MESDEDDEESDEEDEESDEEDEDQDVITVKTVTVDKVDDSDH